MVERRMTQEEEPLNVRVARALGWKCLPPKIFPDGSKVGVRWRQGLRTYFELPDFANDVEFLWRMMKLNGLSITYDPEWKSWQVTNPRDYEIEDCPTCNREYYSKIHVKTAWRAPDPGIALCNWIVAAVEAGIEIKR